MTQLQPQDNEQELRRQWQELNARIENLERRIDARESTSAGASARDRLLRQIRMLAVVSYLCAILFPTMYFPLSEVPIYVPVSLMLFFLVMGTLDLILCRRIRRLNIAVVDTRTALEEVIGIRRMRRRFQITGITLAFPVLALMFLWLAGEGSYSVGGAVVGAIVGGTIGYFIDRRARRDLRTMENELSE